MTIQWIIKLYSSLVLFIFLFVYGCCELEISYCSEPQSSAILVSTLDGTFTKLNDNGDVKWSFKTGPQPLLNSNIHNLELTNNGRWVRIIPSLTGMLYKFDGHTVDPISVTAETLLRASYKYSEDLVMAGSINLKTFGIGFRSGQVFYECSHLDCKNVTGDVDAEDDVLVLTRTTQTVRAIEPHTGNEKWNFSVGDVNVNLPRISCIDVNAKKMRWDIKAVLPIGLLEVNHVLNNADVKWQYQFPSPIVKVWKWSGTSLEEIDMFLPKEDTFFSPINAALYVGMHNRQLYIHESKRMQNMLDRTDHQDIAVAESKSLSKIPWKPISASPSVEEEDEITGMSVLYGSSYVNGNGFFLYTEMDMEKKNTELCEKNVTIEDVEVGTAQYIYVIYIAPIWVWWKEITVISLTTALLFHMLFRVGLNRQNSVTNSSSNTTLERTRSEELSDRGSTSEGSAFSSRFLNDFDTLQCLGRGGFGVVFQVVQKIDECEYALKRIRLPNDKAKRERVMREVKALAKLEHQNIVRYFNSWVEHPPAGWQQNHDIQWLSGSQATSYITSSHRRTQSVSIAIDTDEEDIPACPSDSSDDFIVFENSKGSDETQISRSTLPSMDDTESATPHSVKKINWKRPSRKSYSLDMTKKAPLEPPIFLYIQMQLCQKENLKDWLLSHPVRDKTVVLDLFKQIISAVEYVHLRGLIHRDLKPGNIFFSLEGQIKVGDFGLVKDVESSLDIESNKMIGQGSFVHTKEVGTRLYMSPEQISSKKYDYKVDIYSLGLIFFELLTPFETDMERYKALTLVRDHEYPQDFRANHKHEYDLLKSMLCENPKKRLTTIGIRAKPPFREADSCYDENCFYELPKMSK